MRFMEPQVNPTPTLFATNILYAPVDSTPFLYQMCNACWCSGVKFYKTTSYVQDVEC